MNNNSNFDKLAREVLKDSYLEMPDPDFNDKILKKILHDKRRQRILQNIFLCLSVFAAVDLLILFAFRFFGFDISMFILESNDISRSILLQINLFKNAVLNSSLFIYILPLIVLLAIIEALTESKFKLSQKL